jgi:diaminohydroxyphosphoribosylaminopyrimidine deaminase / 5-amino-6-(5-phosphoribosylamino)uracil reductase
MATPAELDAMRRAIALSARGLGTTSPNPPVGCVILAADGRVVGQGYHERKGEPHAEAHALAAAGELAKGGTAVVTLEPCNHQGRTPPCRQALIDAKVARVVIALIDPTSRGEGGAAALRAAGVDVETAVIADEARLVLGPWLDALETRRPHVAWLHVPNHHAAGNLLATHALRAFRSACDAVLSDGGLVEEGVPNSHGAGILQLNPKPLSAGPVAVLSSLYDGGVRSLLLSGTPSLAAPFLQADLVDQIVLVDRGGGQQPAAELVDQHGLALPLVPPGFALVRAEKLVTELIIICQREHA